MDKHTRQTVGRNIKSLRKKRGLRAKDTAERCGVGRQYYYLMEQGSANMPLDTLDRVADALDVSVVDLVSRAKRKRAA